MGDEPQLGAALLALMGEVKATVIRLGLGAGRMTGMILFLPIFTRIELGAMLSGAIAFALALPVLAGMIDPLAAAADAADTFVALLVAKEVAVGAGLGLALGLPFWAVSAVGELVDAQRSIGQPGTEDPATKSQATAFSALLMMTAIVLFVSQGGLRIVADVVYGSYGAWPLDTMLPDMRGDVMGALSRLALAGLLVAGPFLAVFLVTDIALAGAGKLGGRLRIDSLLPLTKNLIFLGLLVLLAEPLSRQIGRLAATLGLGLDLDGVVP